MKNIVAASEIISAVRTLSIKTGVNPRVLLSVLPGVRAEINKTLETADIDDEYETGFDCTWFGDIDGNQYRIEHGGEMGSSMAMWWLRTFPAADAPTTTTVPVRRSGTVVSILARRLMIKD